MEACAPNSYHYLGRRRQLSTGTFITQGAFTFGTASAVVSGGAGALIGFLTAGPAGAIALGTALAITGGISGAISGAITGAAIAVTGRHKRPSEIARTAALTAGAVGAITGLLCPPGGVINAITGGVVDYMVGKWLGKRLARKANPHRW